MSIQERRKRLLHQRAELEIYLNRLGLDSTRAAIAEVDRQLHELEIDERRDRFAASMLLPAYHRPFIEACARHLLEAAARSTVEQVYLVPRGAEWGNFWTRSMAVFAASDETSIARIAHELVHASDAEAHGQQHRCSQTKDAVNSPIAEMFAWVRAAELLASGGRAIAWTAVMEAEAERCLGTYRGMATAAERTAMDQVIETMRRLVRPAPDTDAGRAARVEQLQPSGRPAYGVRLERLRELGLGLAETTVAPDITPAVQALRRLSRGEGVADPGEPLPIDEPVDRDARRRLQATQTGLRALEAENRRLATGLRVAEQARRRAEREAERVPWAPDSPTGRRWAKLQLIAKQTEARTA